MSSAAADLARAERLLSTDVPGANRMAAWLARSALEAAVVNRLQALGHDVGQATMGSRLTCLYVLAPGHAAVAEFAWNRLSRACHHHAFELAPTAGEVCTLVDHVARVAKL